MSTHDYVVRSSTVGAATDNTFDPSLGQLQGNAFLLHTTRNGLAPMPPTRTSERIEAATIAKSYTNPNLKPKATEAKEKLSELQELADSHVPFTTEDFSRFQEESAKARLPDQYNAEVMHNYEEEKIRRAKEIESRREEEEAVKAQTAEALRYVLLSEAERSVQFEREGGYAAEDQKRALLQKKNGSGSGSVIAAQAATPGLHTTLDRRAAESSRLVPSTKADVSKEYPHGVVTDVAEARSVTSYNETYKPVENVAPTEDQDLSEGPSESLNLEGLTTRELSFINVSLMMLREKNPQHRMLYGMQCELAKALQQSKMDCARNDGAGRTTRPDEMREEPSAQAMTGMYN